MSQIHNGTTVTALFDPATNLWTQGTPMHYPRWYGTTTTLPDGRVLVNLGRYARRRARQH